MLIVNPNNRIRTVKPDLPAIEPPLWAGLCASYLNADILDAEAEDLSIDQTLERIYRGNDNQVLLVVMGNNPSVSSTPKMPIAETLAERLKDKYHVALTGLHPLAVGSRFPVMRIEFKQGSGFPVMPWNKLPMAKYRAHNWHCLDGSSRVPYASIYTSLGCPFDCYYCPIHTLYGNRQVRFRPIDDVLEEVEILVTRYQVRNIKIWDELFALNEDRVISICSGLEGYSLNIWAYARLDTITEKMLKAMKDGGVNWLAYGFESVADPKFIKDTERKIAMTRDAGINIIANFMFGLPGVTADEDRQSVEFAKKHLFEFINFYDAKPYPGSQWYKDIKIETDYDFSQYGHQSDYRKWAFKDYFSNSDYIGMIIKKFGEQARIQIENMLVENFG